jgi:hypothetical protein
MIKVASFTAPAGPLSDDYNATLIATADTLSDPSSATCRWALTVTPPTSR